MNIAGMSIGARLWWLVVQPLLAGLGIVRILQWLPQRWAWVAIGVLAVAAMIWAVRELRWSRRMQREIAADLEKLDGRRG